MSDPNMDLADLATDIQARAWEDFTAWERYRDANSLWVPADMGAAADMYARHCETGRWPLDHKKEEFCVGGLGGV